MTPAEAAYAVLNSPAASGNDPDVLAYKARTAAFLFKAGFPLVTADDVRSRMDALWTARYSNAGSVGYGLGYAWDAFQDGTTNPASTIYTYTSMVSALALIEGAEAVSDDTYLGYASQLANTATTACWGYTNGPNMSVWYSDQAADKKGSSYVVHNCNALLLAVLNRLSLEEAKQAGMRSMLASTIEVGGKWRYILGGPTYNDLVHHAYMVEGVLTAGMPEAQPALARVWEFYRTNGTFDTSNVDVMGSAKWGPPDGLSALAMSPQWTTQAGMIASVIANSVGADGVSSFADRTVPRSVIHYGVGLARYAASVI